MRDEEMTMTDAMLRAMSDLHKSATVNGRVMQEKATERALLNLDVSANDGKK